MYLQRTHTILCQKSWPVNFPTLQPNLHISSSKCRSHPQFQWSLEWLRIHGLPTIYEKLSPKSQKPIFANSQYNRDMRGENTSYSGRPSRWQRSKTWRSLSSPQIHQNYIYMWNNSYRTPTERWQKTSDFPKGKKLPHVPG